MKVNTVWEKTIGRLSNYHVGCVFNKEKLAKKIKIKHNDKYKRIVEDNLFFLMKMGFVERREDLNTYKLIESIPPKLSYEHSKYWVKKYSLIDRISQERLKDSIDAVFLNFNSAEELRQIKNMGGLLKKMNKTLIEKDIQEIKSAMNRTWSAIGNDVLMGVEQLERDGVIEVVLDANYIDMYGKMSKPVLEKFNKLPYEEKEKIAKEVFTAEIYC